MAQLNIRKGLTEDTKILKIIKVEENFAKFIEIIKKKPLFMEELPEITGFQDQFKHIQDIQVEWSKKWEEIDDQNKKLKETLPKEYRTNFQQFEEDFDGLKTKIGKNQANLEGLTDFFILSIAIKTNSKNIHFQLSITLFLPILLNQQ